MYAFLSDREMTDLARGRLLELERQHYAHALKIAELDFLGVPPDSPEWQAIEKELRTVAEVIRFHQDQLGVLPAPPRVEGAPGAQTGDDEGIEPVGEEPPK